MRLFQQTLDEDAFAQLAARYLARGMAVARQFVRVEALAEEAVQEAFLKVVRTRDRYIPSKPFSSWFYAILRNVCVDMIRRQGREARAIQDIALRSDWTSRPAPQASDIQTMLAGLPPNERAALTLRVMDGLPIYEVAAALSISDEAAKKRIQRALQHLRAKWAPHAGVLNADDLAAARIRP